MLSKTVNLFEVDGSVIEKVRSELTQNKHLYAICCQPEVDGDAI